LYKEQESQVSVFEFQMPWGGHLNPENRWIKLAEIIPWQEIEEQYASKFNTFKGNVAKPARLAFGALFVQAKMDLRDRECAELIAENPYIQYFLGFSEYQSNPPVSASTFVYFRKRIKAAGIARINEILCGVKQQDKDDDDPPASSTDGGEQDMDQADSDSNNEGTLILDATCAPQDIRYPTDLTLLNDARRILEGLIDQAFRPLRGSVNKPRTDRKEARDAYLAIAKKRKVKYNKMRAAVGKQLRFVRKDLEILDQLLSIPGHGALSEQDQGKLRTIQKLYEQQQTMFEQRIHRVDDRIVSITQPYVRPVIRGKAGSSVEFGAKISISVKDGLCFVDKIGWDNFSEGSLLHMQCQNYHRRFGCYPSRVLADKAYLSQDNRRWCKKMGIALPGPRLGRPPKQTDPEEKRKQLAAGKERNEVEGRFGISKRRYGLELIMCKLQQTSETEIMMQFIAMNADQIMRKQSEADSVASQKQEQVVFNKKIPILAPVRENLCFAF
jgi:transposase, IS5 family